MEKSIPRVQVGSQTAGIIEQNGGEVGSQQIILRNIQQERPYLNTGATMVIFKSGEYIYYNERGIWTDDWPSMTRGGARVIVCANRKDESIEAMLLYNKGSVLMYPVPSTTSNKSRQEAPEIPGSTSTEFSAPPASLSLTAHMGSIYEAKLCANRGANSACRLQCVRGPP
jgi:hypothetical protein